MGLRVLSTPPRSPKAITSVSSRLLGVVRVTKLLFSQGRVIVKFMSPTPASSAQRSLSDRMTQSALDYLFPMLGKPYRGAFLLPLLGASFHYGPFSVALYYFAVPVAAWLGYRYGRRGITAVAFGMSPLLYGSPVINGFRLNMQPDLYVVSVLVCWAFAHPKSWWQQLESLKVTQPSVAALFVVAGGSVYFAGSFGSVGWYSGGILLPFAVFALGLSGQDSRPVFIYAAAMGVLGMGLYFWELSRRSVQLEYGLKFFGGYYYDNVPEILLVVLMLAFGRHVAGALKGETPKAWIGPWQGYLLFAVLWLFALHWVKLIIPLDYVLDGRHVPYGRIALAGSNWLILALAFMAGMTWQYRGAAILGGAVLIAIVESFIVAFYGISDHTWTLNEGMELRLTLPHIGRYLDVYIAALPFCYLGIHLSRALDLAPAHSVIGPLFAKWASLDYKRILIPWLFLPLMPLLVSSYRFSPGVGFHLEYLVLPFAIWLANRYGRHALWALAVGMITYWVGLEQNPGLRLSPDLYLVALLLAWATVYPDQWLPLLKRLDVPYAAKLVIFALLPVVAIGIVEELKIGWNLEVLFLFTLFVLGWAGAPARSTIGLVLAFGVIGILARAADLSIHTDELRLYYSLNSIRAILEVTLWYVSGKVLNGFCFNPSVPPDTAQPAGENPAPQSDAKDTALHANNQWITDRKTYFGVGVLMFMAPFYLSIAFPVLHLQIWGSKWLIMLAFFMAGFLWGRLGMHLAAAVAAALWFASFLLFPVLLQDSSLTWDLGGFLIAFRAPNESYVFIALIAFLYCLLGIRLSTWLKHRNAGDDNSRNSGSRFRSNDDR